MIVVVNIPSLYQNTFNSLRLYNYAQEGYCYHLIGDTVRFYGLPKVRAALF